MKEDNSRKQDHLDLAFESQSEMKADARFYYEPVFGTHAPWQEVLKPTEFFGKTLKAPLWITSMTGGVAKGKEINRNLAKLAREFGLGMGLGSCRPLLESDSRLDDFKMRSIIGDDCPLFANIGIAQVEQMLAEGSTQKLPELVYKLQADGLIIHLNPIQEWLQPEGDRLKRPIIETLQEYLEGCDLSIIVKEVGRGMGPASLRALTKLQINAIEFGAYGGTNFGMLELARGGNQAHAGLANVGHSASEMVRYLNELKNDPAHEMRCKSFIISGGVKDFLDGHYLLKALGYPGIYGQGQALLKHAMISYESLHDYVENQLSGLAIAESFLRCRGN